MLAQLWRVLASSARLSLLSQSPTIRAVLRQLLREKPKTGWAETGFLAKSL
jgi:hypothetical protein